MHVINTYKFKMDQIESNREKVATLIFDAQGQLTLWFLKDLAENFNSFKLSCMSSLLASMKRIRSRTVEKKLATPFIPIISLWGFFQTLKGR